MRLQMNLIALISFVLLFMGTECKNSRSGSAGGGRPGGYSYGGSKKTSFGGSKSSSPKLGPKSGPKTISGKPQAAGPPPAYPGLGSHPANSPNAPPPAYSPSLSMPPPYNPSFNRPSSYNFNPKAYGTQFGKEGLSSNTFISNNYYGIGNSRSGGVSSYLTSAIFYASGWRHGFWLTSEYRHQWDENKDRRWRATTKAPYFENKIPGSESYLPAASVVGAATAFGLVSLLPLNVPKNKPLMYCNSTEIAQTQIRIEENIYSCVNQTIAVSCPKSLEDESVVDECLSSNKTLQCDMNDDFEKLFCTNATLVSRVSLVCNSTTVIDGNINDTTAILDCFEGSIPSYSASFIPTTTEAPVKPVEKRLSMSAKVHIFFMKISGKSDIVEKVRTSTTTATPSIESRFLLNENETLWVPEALTIPPETTSTTKAEEENSSFSDEMNEDDEEEMDLSTHGMIEDSTNETDD